MQEGVLWEMHWPLHSEVPLPQLVAPRLQLPF
jgi:hypothetical protein